MANAIPMGQNEDHDPGPIEEEVLSAFKTERRETGESRMTPAMIRDHVDNSKQNVNYALDQLTAAGWVNQPATGIYEFVDDPREDSDE